MQTIPLTLRFSVAQMRDAAMCAAGISPKAMALKPGVRVNRNRKAEARLGHRKHKAQCLD